MRKRWLNDTEKIKEQLKRRYRKQQVIVAALTLNMRGVLNATSSEYLKERRIISQMDVWLDFCVLALSSRQHRHGKTETG